MQGKLVGGKSTPISLINHSFFNLAGHDSPEGIYNHLLEIDADTFSQVDAEGMPTRKMQNLEDEGPEFMNLKMGAKLGDAIKEQGLELGFSEEDMDKEISGQEALSVEDSEKLGIDHNYAFNREDGDTTLAKMASLFHPNGRYLEVHTTAPGIMLYTANNKKFRALKGKGGAVYKRRCGVALETQTYPSSVDIDLTNEDHKEFNKGRCFWLKAGNPSYLHECVFSFGWRDNK